MAIPNVIITPHPAGRLIREADRLTGVFVDNLKRFLAGAPVVSAVIPS
ncbi:hypothetical protein Pla175_28850 [Pirellulimonas nuda]|uniref:Uncharacterized protein n=1 Tax=Pirellulimonas nuda TaxID=2528009 RepID=A0A518DDD5_9BACT|nr:hypothetical protein [Pirellulimonas nuda]QDU89494.1 hypothetical protein Pla175_28850 [Pirellulimonas nuda]